MKITLKDFLDAICFSGRTAYGSTKKMEDEYGPESYAEMEMKCRIFFGTGVFETMELFLKSLGGEIDCFEEDDIENKVMWRLIDEFREHMFRLWIPWYDEDWDRNQYGRLVEEMEGKVEIKI